MTINELFERARSGDPRAERQLYDRMYERFMLILQHRFEDSRDIKEILQETLTSIASKSKSMDFKYSFSSWAYKVLNNNIIYHYRIKARKRKRFTRMPEHIEFPDSTQIDPALKKHLLDCLKKVNKVNIRHARILNLAYQGYNADFISKKMGITKNAVYTLLSRARSMLKTCLEKGEI